MTQATELRLRYICSSIELTIIVADQNLGHVASHSSELNINVGRGCLEEDVLLELHNGVINGLEREADLVVLSGCGSRWEIDGLADGGIVTPN